MLLLEHLALVFRWTALCLRHEALGVCLGAYGFCQLGRGLLWWARLALAGCAAAAGVCDLGEDLLLVEGHRLHCALCCARVLDAFCTMCCGCLRFSSLICDCLRSPVFFCAQLHSTICFCVFSLPHNLVVALYIGCVYKNLAT